MKKLLVLLAVIGICGKANADPIIWQTPYGTFGLPFAATESLIGYDAVLKQAIGGFSLPVYTDPREIVALQLGAVAPWPIGNQSAIQPYIAAGTDILKFIPDLKNYRSLHFNVFGRYVTVVGKAGVGASLSYSFAGGSLTN